MIPKSIRPRFLALGAAALALGSASARAGGAKPIEELDIAELLDTPVEVASRTARTLRETPGVVTVLSREEIQASGARDLSDLLMRVPGFWFGVDVLNVVGVGFRGNWAHEGKVLLRIDGQEMNENLYATLQFGNHYPVDEIEKIEIIRGPGSAIYSGYAELAVIDVTTRAGKIDGASASLSYGQFPKDFGHAKAELAAGHTFANGLHLGGVASVGAGNRSDGVYTDLAGDKASLGHGASTSSDEFLDLVASWKELELRLLFDLFGDETIDGYDTILAAPRLQTFATGMGDLTWKHPFSDRLRLEVTARFGRQVPWYSDDEQTLFYEKDDIRGGLHAALSWDAAKGLNLLGGIEAYRDIASLLSTKLVGFQSQFGDQNQVVYWNRAAFAQALWDTPVVDVALGVRGEGHSQYGVSVVPRLALTRKFDRFHAKLLGAGSLRAPAVENINTNPAIKPERTWSVEAEAGYQFGEHLFASANAFFITVQDPIYYLYDENTGAEGYANGHRTGSHGVEVDARYQARLVSGGLAYSYSSSALPPSLTGTGTDSQNDVSSYEVPGDSALLLGMPQHKLVLWATWRPRENVTVSPSAIFVSERAAYLPNPNGDAEIGRLAPLALVNVVVAWHDAFAPGLTLGAGVYNLLNQTVWLAEPYATGGHAPLPSMPRELVVRVGYDLGG